MNDDTSKTLIIARGRQLVEERLAALGRPSSPASRGAGAHLVVTCADKMTQRTAWISTNLRPKPAWGGGPPALAWKIPSTVAADVVLLADLSSGRVWAMAKRELETIPQQHAKARQALRQPYSTRNRQDESMRSAGQCAYAWGSATR
jgi:hypothetical protein